MTPECPACSAKFAQDRGRMCCRHCGLPDEIRDAGPRAIARWKHKGRRYISVVDVGTGIVTEQIWVDGMSKRMRKKIHADKPGTRQRRRSKHGRTGVSMQANKREQK